MIARALTRWSLVLVGMLGILLVALPVLAQQPADQPSTQPAAPPATSQPPAAPAAPMPIMQPQPTSVPGRPDIPNAEVATQLRGVPPPPFPMPEDKLPIPQLKLQRLRSRSGSLRASPAMAHKANRRSPRCPRSVRSRRFMSWSNSTCSGKSSAPLR